MRTVKKKFFRPFTYMILAPFGVTAKSHHWLEPELRPGENYVVIDTA